MVSNNLLWVYNYKLQYGEMIVELTSLVALELREVDWLFGEILWKLSPQGLAVELDISWKNKIRIIIECLNILQLTHLFLSTALPYFGML